MAKFARTKTGVAYIKLDWTELINYSKIGFPVCDFCMKDLIGYNNVTLVPILNQALCPECAEEFLKRAKSYPEDAAIEAKREKFYMEFFGLTEGV